MDKAKILTTARTLMESLQTMKAEHLAKFLRVMLLPAVKHWAQESEKRRVLVHQFTPGSEKHQAATREYELAFAQWHHMNHLLSKIQEAQNFKSCVTKDKVNVA